VVVVSGFKAIYSINSLLITRWGHFKGRNSGFLPLVASWEYLLAILVFATSWEHLSGIYDVIIEYSYNLIANSGS